MIAFKDN
jgi:hypothetical protein